MKPGPEHVHRRFLHRPTGVIVAYGGQHIGGAKEVIVTAYAGPMVIDAGSFDRDYELLSGMPELTAAGDELGASPETPLAAIPALLSGLLAAGFDQAEISLFRSKDLPAPILRFRGVVGDEWISYDQIDPGDGDLGRIEAAVTGKLEVLKAAQARKGPSAS